MPAENALTIRTLINGLEGTTDDLETAVGLFVATKYAQTTPLTIGQLLTMVDVVKRRVMEELKTRKTVTIKSTGTNIHPALLDATRAIRESPAWGIHDFTITVTRTSAICRYTGGIGEPYEIWPPVRS